MLKAMGQRNVQVLDGGYKEWSNNNYQTDAGNQEPEKSKRLFGNYKLDQSKYQSFEQMVKLTEDQDHQIVDVRPYE